MALRAYVLFLATVLALIGLTIFERSQTQKFQKANNIVDAYESILRAAPAINPPEDVQQAYKDRDNAQTALLVRSIMQVAFSLVLTTASLFVILSKRYQPKDKHWAYTTIGTILGFWLRG
jgi:hypothetical protein